MTKKKSEGANEDQTIETKKKSASAVRSSQKEKPVVAKQVKSSKEEEEEDLRLDSATDSDYDGDVFFLLLLLLPLFVRFVDSEFL